MSDNYENVTASRAHWWHTPDRVKRCTACGDSKALAEFSAYSYVTKQGKDSTRYESRCRPCNRERSKAYVESNPEKARQSVLRSYEKYRDSRLEYNRSRQKDPAHRANKAKSQRLRKARYRSGEGDNEAIRAIYAEAMRIENVVKDCPVFSIPELGYKMHVDHIKPLAKGGKHHESNLQIIPAGINMRKGVKYVG